MAPAAKADEIELVFDDNLDNEMTTKPPTMI